MVGSRQAKKSPWETGTFECVVPRRNVYARERVLGQVLRHYAGRVLSAQTEKIEDGMAIVRFQFGYHDCDGAYQTLHNKLGPLGRLTTGFRLGYNSSRRLEHAYS